MDDFTFSLIALAVCTVIFFTTKPATGGRGSGFGGVLTICWIGLAIYALNH